MKNIQTFKAGVVQFDVKLGDIDSNLSSAIKGLDQLKAQHAKIALLPEMWSCGFDNKRLAEHSEKTDTIVKKLNLIASRYDMIIAGSLPECSGNNIFNTMYIIDGKRGLINTYRKIHLFSHAQEDKYFCAGNRAVVCETSVGPIGMMICYDLRFPELCRTLTLSGAILVLISAQWPLERISHWDIILQARAIENQIFIVGANRCGLDKNLEYGGSSVIVSPSGEILAGAGDGECIISSEIELAKQSEFRNRIPCLNERVPDTYDY